MTQVIVALDVDTIRQQEDLLVRLKDTVTFYKIGLRLFTAHGKRSVDLVHRFGGKVFLDLKFFDIPQTVAHAVHEAQKLGVEAVSLHLWGGADMLRAATEISPRPKLWGVTVLTSMLAKDMKFFSPRANLETVVQNLAKMGSAHGIDGAICSGREVPLLRAGLRRPNLKFITPGIRPAAHDKHDQRRVLTPGDAAKLGIDFVVIGRPITQAADPLKAAQDILSEMRHASRHSLEVPR